MTFVKTEPEDRYSATEVAIAHVLGRRAGRLIMLGCLYNRVQEESRAKDEFMAMLGHELRNPIGAITNAVSILERLDSKKEPVTQMRAIISRQIRHLARLVDDLLDVSRISSGKITIDRRPLDLREVAERSIATLRATGSAKQHEIVASMGPDPLVVEGDASRLEQVLGNMLDNAVKYTPAGGRIQVTVRAESGAAVIRVRDTGIGIDPEFLPRIFDSFSQGQQTLDRKQGGLGLGLTLVRRLVELHEGNVLVTSPGRGRGTEVMIRLPLRPTSHPESSLRSTGQDAPSRHILVVEDSADSRLALQSLLEIAGHRVEVAEDGWQGLALVLGSRPDIALIDIGLPGIDGYEMARRVRAAPDGHRICLVALTGYGQPADRERSAEAGFDAHLVKPIDLDDLARIIRDGSNHAGPTDGAR
jgi:CheY-like chemotaxis protein